MSKVQIKLLIQAAKVISPVSLEILDLAEKAIVKSQHGFATIDSTEKEFQDFKKDIRAQVTDSLFRKVRDSRSIKVWSKNREVLESVSFNYGLKLTKLQQKDIYLTYAKLYVSEGLLNITDETLNEVNRRFEKLWETLVDCDIIERSDRRFVENPTYSKVGLSLETINQIMLTAKQNSFKQIEDEYLSKFNSSLRLSTLAMSLTNKLNDCGIPIKYWLENTQAPEKCKKAVIDFVS